MLLTDCVAWIGWGKYWDTLAEVTPPNTPDFTKAIKNAIQFYIQGIKCNQQQRKTTLARVIWLLTKSTRHSDFV